MLSPCKAEHLLPISHRCGWPAMWPASSRSLASHPSGASRQSYNLRQGVSKDTAHSPSSPCGPNGDQGLSLAVLFLSTFQLVPARSHQHPGPLFKERSTSQGWERRRLPLQCNLRASLACLFQEWFKINVLCKINNSMRGGGKWNVERKCSKIKWVWFAFSAAMGSHKAERPFHAYPSHHSSSNCSGILTQQHWSTGNR